MLQNKFPHNGLQVTSSPPRRHARGTGFTCSTTFPDRRLSNHRRKWQVVRELSENWLYSARNYVEFGL